MKEYADRANTEHIARDREAWRQAEKDMRRKSSEWRLRGWDVRYILTRSGYTVREFAEYLASNGARITTIRSVYRLMERDMVTTRYADLLKNLVGEDHFLVFVKEIIQGGTAAVGAACLSRRSYRHAVSCYTATALIGWFLCCYCNRQGKRSRGVGTLFRSGRHSDRCSTAGNGVRSKLVM